MGPEGGPFTSEQVCRRVGISYRQLDYWDRNSLICPSVRGANGFGTQRLYSERDAQLVSTVALLLGAGFTFQAIRPIIASDRPSRELRAKAGLLFHLALTLEASGAGR